MRRRRKWWRCRSVKAVSSNHWKLWPRSQCRCWHPCLHDCCCCCCYHCYSAESQRSCNAADSTAVILYSKKVIQKCRLRRRDMILACQFFVPFFYQISLKIYQEFKPAINLILFSNLDSVTFIFKILSSWSLLTTFPEFRRKLYARHVIFS